MYKEGGLLFPFCILSHSASGCCQQPATEGITTGFRCNFHSLFPPGYAVTHRCHPFLQQSPALTITALMSQLPFSCLRYSSRQVEQNWHRKILKLLFSLALAAHLASGGCCGKGGGKISLRKMLERGERGECWYVSPTLWLLQPPLH